MAFALEINISSNQKYIRNYIVSIIRRYGIKTTVKQNHEKLIFVFEAEHSLLSVCLDAIAKELPASFFLHSSSNYKVQEKPQSLPEITNELPLSLGLCPSCQKEMFDASSRRYYYPFTSCTCCGANHSFLRSYPYERINTSFKFLVPCQECEKEIKRVGFKEKHIINSCHTCGVSVRLVNKTTQRYANDAGSFKTMFEVAAKALNDNKKLLIKTTMGYRLFYKSSFANKDSILMMINAGKITDNLSIITEEFNALLSIERPILHVTLKCENLKKEFDFNTAFVKYPDDGFSILLGAELQKLGIEYIAYEEVEESCDADILMDYDLEVTPQSDIRLFLNKEISFIAEGERVSFPSFNIYKRDLLSIANDLVAIPYKNNMLFDNIEYFGNINVSKVNVLEGEKEKYHSNQRFLMPDEASFMSVVAENNVFNKRCVGAYFNEIPSFLYYDTKNVLRIVPPKKFNANNILTEIENLRECSGKLVINLQKKLPEVYAKLKDLESKKEVKLFEAVAIILSLNDISMRGVTKEAMRFVGKGGVCIDTHIKDNRFDNIAFLSSIISYQLAGVTSPTLAYSIFESFGDYFHDILKELKVKTKATEIILCGTHFANQSLFSRIQRNLKMTPPLMNINYPVGKENCVVGGVFF